MQTGLHPITAVIEVRDVTNDKIGWARVELPQGHGFLSLEILVLLLVVGAVTTGCLAPKRSTLFIPRRCMKVAVDSFTKPCVERADGKLVCDQVVVTASCVQMAP